MSLTDKLSLDSMTPVVPVSAFSEKERTEKIKDSTSTEKSTAEKVTGASVTITVSVASPTASTGAAPRKVTIDEQQLAKILRGPQGKSVKESVKGLIDHAKEHTLETVYWGIVGLVLAACFPITGPIVLKDVIGAMKDREQKVRAKLAEAGCNPGEIKETLQIVQNLINFDKKIETDPRLINSQLHRLEEIKQKAFQRKTLSDLAEKSLIEGNTKKGKKKNASAVILEVGSKIEAELEQTQPGFLKSLFKNAQFQEHRRQRVLIALEAFRSEETLKIQQWENLSKSTDPEIKKLADRICDIARALQGIQSKDVDVYSAESLDKLQVQYKVIKARLEEIAPKEEDKAEGELAKKRYQDLYASTLTLV
jgi:hypothetical protein